MCEHKIPARLLKNYRVTVRVRTGDYGAYENREYEVYAVTRSGAYSEALWLCRALVAHEKEQQGLLNFGVEPVVSKIDDMGYVLD